LDYKCDHEVILAVDTSVVAVGFILLQLGEDGKCYPNHFGSITLSEVESCYSQAKLELYGLFHALRAVRVYIFGITNLTVEVDAKYIKGMINNPDLQPNATINRWIMGILLFQFNLIHVPAAKHAGIDGLSRRPPAESDPEEDDDHEDWVDRAYSFGVILLNERMHQVDAAGTQITQTVHNAPYAQRLARLPDMRIFLAIIDAKKDEPPIPRSNKAQVLDAKMVVIKLFLNSCKKPVDLSDEEFKSFVHYAAHFFILEDNLWRRDPQGKHQLVVDPRKCYHILKEAHDDLGHKGVYAVHMRLLLQFWWPHIINNIKWYAHTCHAANAKAPYSTNHSYTRRTILQSSH
jgi:hypothetical protein